MSEDLSYIEKIVELITRYHQNELREEEKIELQTWCAQSASNQTLFDRLSDSEYIKEKIKELPDIKKLKEEGWERLYATVGEGQVEMERTPVRKIYWRRMLVAASLIGFVVVGGWMYLKSRPVETSSTGRSLALNFKNDVAPGGNKAVLTLADGSHVTLDSTVKGTVAHQGAIRIVKSGAGSLAYSALDEKPLELAYNMLTTPAAGQFQVALPDGSKVWLNNASSLRYPVAFTGKNREVELTGEAYFEIAPNARQPFKVKVGEKTVVDVLGTTFNISAYADENNIKTTLLSGGVRVSQRDAQTILKPGEQAQVNEAGELKKLEDVDADGAIAWKNGWFHFERADIKTVMRMLARWYNITVTYEGPVSTEHKFVGEIERKLSLSQVLEILQKNQVHFEIEGKKITVRP